MKYFVRAFISPSTTVLPTATMVLGPFGEVVDYGGGDYYLSWYPVCRRGWSTAIEPPSWPTSPSTVEAGLIAEGTARALSNIVIDLRTVGSELDSSDVRGGIIYALGATDVDDPESDFHQRSDVGVVTLGGWYHSVDTGKYTTAPLFAMETARLVLGS